MISLQGYILATYDDLVATFGESIFEDYESKVSTVFEFDSPVGEIHIYDWKEYDDGRKCRSGRPYEWHIGGSSKDAVRYVREQLGSKGD